MSHVISKERKEKQGRRRREVVCPLNKQFHSPGRDGKQHNGPIRGCVDARCNTSSYIQLSVLENIACKSCCLDNISISLFITYCCLLCSFNFN